MKKWLLAGSALLFIQIILAVTLNLTGQDFGAFTPREKLLDFSPAEADRITISDSDHQLVILKIDGKWQLPDYFTAPADDGQVKSLLDNLAELKQGLVVASSKGAAKRFKVAEDDFEKHVVIEGGDKVIADFFVGSSPGFKKVYARVADRPEIVSVLLNSYDLEAVPEDWLDLNMLRIDNDRIADLAMKDFTLNRSGENGWQLADQPATIDLDQSKAVELVSKTTSLQIKGLVESSEQAGLFGSEPSLSFSITLKDGEKRNYLFAKTSEEGFSYLKLTGYGYLFKLDSWRVDELARYRKEDLLKKEESPGQD